MVSRLRSPIFGWLACVLGLSVVALVSFKVGPAERLDARTLFHLSTEVTGAPRQAASVFAHLADPAPLLLMLIGVCALGVRWGRRREALAAVAVVAGANLTTQFLKVAFNHVRVHDFLGPLQPYGHAFPSGHTTAAASIAVGLVLVAPARLRPLAAVVGAAFTCAVGVSVVVLEWHYPSDVVGAVLVAGGWGFAALAALRLLAERDRRSGAQASSRFAISTK